MGTVAIDSEPALTDKQLAFCREYVVDCNGTKAAIRAGYSEKTAGSIASQLLAKTKVRRRIRKLQRIAEHRSDINKETIQSTLVEIVDRSMQAIPVLDKDGNPVTCETPEGVVVPTYRFDPSAANRSLELLGKTIAAFTDKVEHTGADGAPLDPGIPMEALSDETLSMIRRDLEAYYSAGEKAVVDPYDGVNPDA